MSINAPSELANFYQFVGNALERGETALLPEQLLEQWRSAHPLSEDVIAVFEALRDLQEGDQGTPLAEYEKQLLARHGLKPRP